MPWNLEISLTRKTDEINKPLVEGGDNIADVKIIGRLNTTISENTAYRLWKVESTNSAVAGTEVPMYPNPNDADAGFTGSFYFNASIEDTLLLTCYKAYCVVITDPASESVYSLKIRAGQSLEDSGEYMALDIHDGYSDPAAGKEYEFAGLVMQPDSNDFYDTEGAVTKAINLYAVYKQVDDPGDEGSA
jgi:hypothetical protein